jgi:hypothetical protein
MIAAVGAGLAGCGQEAAPGPAAPPPVRVVADPVAETSADETMLSQAGAIRNALLPLLQAKACRSTGGGDGACRKLAIPCAVQTAVSPEDQAAGVAYRLIFMTSFEAQSGQAWRADGEYIPVEIRPDGTWSSLAASEREGGSCAGEGQGDSGVVRRIGFSP